MVRQINRISRKVIWENLCKSMISIERCGSTIIELVIILFIERRQLDRKYLRNSKGILMVWYTSRSRTILKLHSTLLKVISQLKTNNTGDHKFITSRKWLKSLNWSKIRHPKSRFVRLSSISQQIVVRARLKSSIITKMVRYIGNRWRLVVKMLLVKARWTISMIKRVIKILAWINNSSSTILLRKWSRNATHPSKIIK